MIKICFVTLHTYSLFNRSTQYVFGGSEVRSRLFGLGLSECHNYDVSFVVLNHGRLGIEQYNRIKVYRHSYYKTGARTWVENIKKYVSIFASWLHINDFYINPTKISIYQEINADIYCTFGVHDFSAEIAKYCKKYNKKFVLFSGSDADFSKEVPRLDNPVKEKKEGEEKNSRYMSFLDIDNMFGIYVSDENGVPILRETSVNFTGNFNDWSSTAVFWFRK